MPQRWEQQLSAHLQLAVCSRHGLAPACARAAARGERKASAALWRPLTVRVERRRASIVPAGLRSTAYDSGARGRKTRGHGAGGGWRGARQAVAAFVVERSLASARAGLPDLGQSPSAAARGAAHHCLRLLGAGSGPECAQAGEAAPARAPRRLAIRLVVGQGRQSRLPQVQLDRWSALGAVPGAPRGHSSGPSRELGVEAGILAPLRARSPAAAVARGAQSGIESRRGCKPCGNGSISSTRGCLPAPC